MRIRTLSFIALATISCTCSGFVSAQDPLDEMYGQAVHSYFRGDSLKSEELLNEVIAAGSFDPRVYFYRGLCHVRNGNTIAASADFEKGAQLEIDGKKVVPVGRSLERVQGAARVEIEKARSKARLASRARLLEMQRNRYEGMQQQGGAAEGGLVVPPRIPAVNPSNALAPNDPFNSGMTRGAPQPAEQVPATPATETPEATPTPAGNPDDVFGSDPTPTPAPAGGAEDDPFGG